MKIKQVTWQHRNDFVADMECEHCDDKSKLASGYNDAYYHDKVIPAMHCAVCGLNRSGELPTVDTKIE